jgi:thiosulfate dehydrogenase
MGWRSDSPRGQSLLEHPPPVLGATTKGKVRVFKMAQGGGFGKVVLGFVLAIVVIAAVAAVYLHWGSPPVATSDKPFPFERQVVRVPLNARIDREMKTAPFGVSEDVYEGGAKIYQADCAACHGTPGHDVPFGKYMYPGAPQLWKKHARNNGVGVSNDEPGETYWKVANGIRLTGMPAFEHVLSDTEMWQVSLLLKNADQQLPDPVVKLLAAK